MPSWSLYLLADGSRSRHPQLNIELNSWNPVAEREMMNKGVKTKLQRPTETADLNRKWGAHGSQTDSWETSIGPTQIY